MAEQQVQTQHPIPQQVLGVEFKLVGNLTLRQFGILAFCGLLAYAFFVSKIFIVLRLLLSATFLITGVALAFVPIQDQPLDRWLASFFRAIYSPTKRVWQKIPEPLEFLVVPIPKLVRTVEEGISPEEARQRLEEYLAAVKEKEALSPLDLAEKQQLEFINLELQAIRLEAGLPPALLPPPRPFLPKRRFEEAEKKPSLASTINYAAEPVFKLQRGEKITYVTTLRNVKVGRRLSYTPAAAEVVFAPAREKVIEPTPPMPEVEPIAPPPPPPRVRPIPPVPKEVRAPAPIPPGAARPTPTEMIPALRPPPAPPPPKKAPPPPKPPPPERIRVKPLPKEPRKVELKPPPPPVGEPNSISGTIYDEKGGTIEGALVAVKDQTGMTIQAAKTNQLGQFAFSPLPNGYYTVELPKAKLPFAIMRVELTGVIVPPLEIKAKA